MMPYLVASDMFSARCVNLAAKNSCFIFSPNCTT